MRLNKTYSFYQLLPKCICIYYIFFILCTLLEMANTKLSVAEFATNSVKLIDDAIVINFTSDWVEKKKTLPLTEKWLAVKDGLKKIFDMPEYDVTSIWTDIKEGWRLYDCVIDLAREAKAKQAVVDNAFAELGLWNADPIDEL